MGGWTIRDVLRENTMVSVFFGLKVINHFLAQLEIVQRSEFKVRAATSGFSTTTERLVSSANNSILAPDVLDYIIYVNQKQKRS